MHQQLSRRGLSLLLAAALFVAACGSDGNSESAGSSSEPTVSTVITEQSSADTEEVPVGTEEVPEGLAATFEATGDPAADTVIVNAQGGPVSQLSTGDDFDTLKAASGLDDAYYISVHQAQTLNPDRFTEADIDFEQAKAAANESVTMLADVVDHFLAQDRRVYVVGISYGAFVVQDLLATKGNVADGYLIMVGRLDMPEEVWSAFADGRAAGFVEGTDVVEFEIEEAGMGTGTPVGDRNMARLAAGLGHKRFTELLKGVDLSGTTYVFGENDEQVGRLTEAEISFLENAGATVASDPGGHGEATLTIIEHLPAMLGSTS